MIGSQMGYVRVSPCSPRITITMGWGCDVPAGQIGLYMKRMGSPAEFAVYPPTDISGSVLTFQFDDLLFTQEQGRYEGRLVVGDRTIRSLQFEYYDPDTVLSVENPNV